MKPIEFNVKEWKEYKNKLLEVHLGSKKENIQIKDGRIITGRIDKIIPDDSDDQKPLKITFKQLKSIELIELYLHEIVEIKVIPVY
jgi:hypothetical protein